MNINQVKSIITKTVKAKGYELEERESVSTSSLYFKIYSGDTSLLFRVADHKTEKDIITLRVDHKINEKNVKGFVENRCKDLSKRRIKKILGM